MFVYVYSFRRGRKKRKGKKGEGILLKTNVRIETKKYTHWKRRVNRKGTKKKESIENY